MGYAIKSSVDQRRDIRFPTSFRAAIRWANRLLPVEVTDIANHGLRLGGPDLPDLGTIVQVGARGLDERGYVIWKADDHCGVRLTRRISALAVVRANCFPARHGLQDGRRQDAAPDWVDETMLAQFSASAVTASRFSAGRRVPLARRMARRSH
jgi:hypothetical protein